MTPPAATPRDRQFHPTPERWRSQDFPPLLCGFASSRLCVKFFASMADESFKEFVLDQLSALPDVHARAMFGAHGLYSGGRFFGILDEGRLFFKTHAITGGLCSAWHGTVHL